MPDFGTAESTLKLDHKLNKDELIRSIRFFIAAEFEAVQMYMQVAESTDDELSKKVLKSVSDEELVHAGEFLAVLKRLNPEENSFYIKGETEVGGEEVKNSNSKSTPEEIADALKKKKLEDMFGTRRD